MSSTASAKRSVLLQLARDSIQEVLEAKNSIDKASLLKEHPLLNQNIPTTINIYINSVLENNKCMKYIIHKIEINVLFF